MGDFAGFCFEMQMFLISFTNIVVDYSDRNAVVQMYYIDQCI